MEDKHITSSGCVYKDLDICDRAYKAVNNHDMMVEFVKEVAKDSYLCEWEIEFKSTELAIKAQEILNNLEGE